MSDRPSQVIAPAALVIGAVLGIAGTFAPTASLRGLLWGIDGTALVIGMALLTMYHFRRGNDVIAAGFLVFVAAEALILAASAMEIESSGPTFAAGAVLWAASMGLLAAPKILPTWLRGAAMIGALLFGYAGIQIFCGATLTPLSEPLPFFAYPFLGATLVGCAWVHYRKMV